MTLRAKFNLWVGLVLALGVASSGYVTYGILHRNARTSAVQTANLLMATAEATRSYTTTFIKPHLDQRLEIEFLPQAVPAFAATEMIISLRRQFPEFTYKEATLNPTNPRDRTTDWEADVVNVFVADSTRNEIVGERMQGAAKALYLAKPIRIGNAACLKCHSVPSSAPPAMLKIYGDANGFGWKRDEIVGAQIVSVPLAAADRAAGESFAIIFGVIVVLALGVLATGNVLIRRSNTPPGGNV